MKTALLFLVLATSAYAEEIYLRPGESRYVGWDVVYCGVERQREYQCEVQACDLNDIRALADVWGDKATKLANCKMTNRFFTTTSTGPSQTEAREKLLAQETPYFVLDVGTLRCRELR